MGEQASGIFRKKALDNIKSPDQLTDYLQVANPGIWVLLAAVIILLGGLFVWSAAGTLETISYGVAEVKEGQAVIMVTENNGKEVASGMTVRIGNDEYEVSKVEKDEYGRSLAYAPVKISDGKYDVRIVTESIHPIQFLLN